MATVYNVKISMCSPWRNFDEKTVTAALEETLKGFKVDGNRLSNIEVKVKRVA